MAAEGRRGSARAVSILIAATICLEAAAPADAAQVARNERVTVSDGVSLDTTVIGEGPLRRRPVVVEFSPYGRGTRTADPGPDYNFLLVQIRGTGGSDGRFDALGPRTQADVAEVLEWACHQPWSNGRLGLNGFSASAITIYNSLHRELPCVRAAVLRSGTFELYRDLIYPGGVSNLVPGAGVLGLIGAPALAQAPERASRAPASGVDTAQGLFGAGLDALRHTSLDRWWRERGFRGDVNHLPILMIDGFFDVESRGAFQAFQELRGDGARLIVVGAHDGTPAGTAGGAAATKAWFDRNLLGEHNRIRRTERVKLLLADGDREEMLAGKFVRYEGSDWPIPGTRWIPLGLDPRHSGSASSINDGSLEPGPAERETRQSYPALPSSPLSTDPYNTAIIGAGGINALATGIPALTEMGSAERLGLSYTTEPLSRDVLAAGPLSLELRLSTTAPETAVWAVLSDVSPDGSPHPVAAGRLLSSYPEVNRRKSLEDPRSGAIVQPYGRYDEPRPADPGTERRYRIEFWPVGNRFREGHRLRLHILGASAASRPGTPAINTIRLGGEQGSRLLFPVLPGSDLRRALR